MFALLITGIGALMKSRGLLQPGQTSMQGIVAWLHANASCEGRVACRFTNSAPHGLGCLSRPLGERGSDASEACGRS